MGQFTHQRYCTGEPRKMKRNWTKSTNQTSAIQGQLHYDKNKHERKARKGVKPTQKNPRSPSRLQNLQTQYTARQQRFRARTSAALTQNARATSYTLLLLKHIHCLKGWPCPSHCRSKKRDYCGGIQQQSRLIGKRSTDRQLEEPHPRHPPQPLSAYNTSNTDATKNKIGTVNVNITPQASRALRRPEGRYHESGNAHKTKTSIPETRGQDETRQDKTRQDKTRHADLTQTKPSQHRPR